MKNKRQTRFYICIISQLILKYVNAVHITHPTVSCRAHIHDSALGKRAFTKNGKKKPRICILLYTKIFAIKGDKMFTYFTSGTCSRQIIFEVENNKLHSVKFIGGCSGNLQGVSKLVEGYKSAAFSSHFLYIAFAVFLSGTTNFSSNIGCTGARIF